MSNKKKQLIEESVVKGKYLAGLINEDTYQDLLDKIAVDYQAQLDYEKERDDLYLLENKKIFDSLEDVIDHSLKVLDGKTIEESTKEKWAADVKPKKGKMHDILEIPKDKKISDVYTSGKKLADALMKKVGDEHKVAGMLAFAANTNKEDDVFDKALRYMKKIDESKQIEESDFIL